MWDLSGRSGSLGWEWALGVIAEPASGPTFSLFSSLHYLSKLLHTLPAGVLLKPRAK